MSLSLVVESWTWYGLSWVIVIFRMISRRVLHGSFRKLQIDDWLMLFVMATDTVLMTGMNIISHTSSNLIAPDDHTPLTPENIKERVFGSKMVLVVEQMQILTIWTVKCCLLIMYGRLMTSVKQHMVVRVVAGYVALGFIVMEVLYMGVWCRPFHEYWAVPSDSVQCTAATNHLITNAVLNISSDIMIIIIPMPIVLAAQLPPKRKALLCGIFALGTFTILSAILNKYYSFTNPFGSEWTFWYIRESSTAIITANLPFTWTLLRLVFNLHSFAGRSSNRDRTASRYRSYGAKSGGTNIRSQSVLKSNKSIGSHHGKSVNLGRFTTSLRTINDERDLGDPDTDIELARSESQEQINKSFAVPLKIYQQREVEIHSSEVDPSQIGIAKSSPSNPMRLGMPIPTEDAETGSERSAVGVVTTISRGV